MIEALSNAVTVLADETDSDVYLLSAPIERAVAGQLHDQWALSERRENCIVVLCTFGGDANAAYVMARLLRRVYKKVTVVVFGYCKSAGTLLALGAHEIVMGSRAELGSAGRPTRKGR